MRLQEKEVSAIRSILLGADPGGKIFIFGSRADDALKGGDIDIFLEASTPIDLRSRLMLEHHLAVECDTKIDLLVKNPNDSERLFFSIARQGCAL